MASAVSVNSCGAKFDKYYAEKNDFKRFCIIEQIKQDLALQTSDKVKQSKIVASLVDATLLEGTLFVLDLPRLGCCHSICNAYTCDTAYAVVDKKALNQIMAAKVILPNADDSIVMTVDE